MTYFLADNSVDMSDVSDHSNDDDDDVTGRCFSSMMTSLERRNFLPPDASDFRSVVDLAMKPRRPSEDLAAVAPCGGQSRKRAAPQPGGRRSNDDRRRTTTGSDRLGVKSRRRPAEPTTPRRRQQMVPGPDTSNDQELQELRLKVCKCARRDNRTALVGLIVCSRCYQQYTIS